MEVGDLIQSTVTGRIFLLAEHAPNRFGNAWIRIWQDGKLSKWKCTQQYKLVEK